MTLKKVIGGIVSVEYIYPHHIDFYSIIQDEIILRLKNNSNWIPFPIAYMSTIVDSQEEITNAGIMYKNEITIKIKKEELSPSILADIRNIKIAGAIIRYTTVCGSIYILGGINYPMFGILKDINSQNVTDFSGYTLKLSNKSIYPPLPYRLL